jgi:hypothetical protein
VPSGRPGTAANPGGGTSPAGEGGPAAANQELAAAQRFAALPAAARHAWLMTHLAALRAGQISPSEVP